MNLALRTAGAWAVAYANTHWYAPSVKSDVKSLVNTPDHQAAMEFVSYRAVQQVTVPTMSLQTPSTDNGDIVEMFAQ